MRHLTWLDVHDVLRKGPLVSLRIDRLVAAVSARPVFEFRDDGRARRSGSAIVLIDVVDVDVQHAADATSRAVAMNRWFAEGDQAVGHLHLGAADGAIG